MRALTVAPLLFILLLSVGCGGNRVRPAAAGADAAQGPTAPGMPPDFAEEEGENDPWEGINRKVFKFNTAVDKAVLKPVAKAYDKVMPELAKKGVGNVFRNLGEPTVIVNDLLQGKFKQSLADTARFVANSTIGLLGLFDVATSMGLPRHQEDFGQTLAVWGLGDGPFLMLPFLGPRNLRDTGGFVVDWYTDPVTYHDPEAERWGIRALGFIDTRAQLLTASSVLEQATDDEYLFLREAYRQKRLDLIHDGEVPAHLR